MHKHRSIRVRLITIFASTAMMVLVTCHSATAQQAPCHTLRGFIHVSAKDLSKYAVKTVEPTDPLIDNGTVHAKVKVTVFVNEAGDVVCARTEGTPNTLLGRISLRAARQWKFVKSSESNRPKAMKGTIVFNIER